MVCTLRRPQKSKGGTQHAWEGVPNVLGTKYNIKYSDDAQDTKQGVATDATAGVTDSTTAAATVFRGERHTVLTGFPSAPFRFSGSNKAQVRA